MSDLDMMLARMRAAPVDARFDGLEDAVMQGLSRRREAMVARRGLMLAGVMAVGIGGLGSMMPLSRIQVSRTQAAAPALIGMSDYAPSRLLEP